MTLLVGSPWKLALQHFPERLLIQDNCEDCGAKLAFHHGSKDLLEVSSPTCPTCAQIRLTHDKTTNYVPARYADQDRRLEELDQGVQERNN